MIFYNKFLSDKYIFIINQIIKNVFYCLSAISIKYIPGNLKIFIVLY